MDKLRRQEYEERQNYENSRRSGMLAAMAAMEKRDTQYKERENDIRVQEIIVQGLAKELERSANEIERLKREIARIKQK